MNFKFSKSFIISFFLITSFITCLINCGGGTTSSNSSDSDSDSSSDSSSSFITPDVSNLPLITSFFNSPSDQFLISESDMAKLSRTLPFFGNSTECAHTGGHLHFTNDEAPYLVGLYAPADGIVSRIDKCFASDLTDRFGLDLTIAKTQNNEAVSMHYSIEPIEIGDDNAFPCSQGDDDFFSEYILVSLGQEVQKGDLLAYFPKFENQSDDGAHLHFNLRIDNQHCPNIFNSAIVSSFSQNFTQQSCGTNPIPETFCYQPDSGEDLVSQD